MNQVTLKHLDDTQNDRWDQYVNSHSEGHFFHLTKWKQVLMESFGYSPHYLYLQDNMGSITGVLPLMKVKSILTGRRIISLPFSFACGPIADSIDCISLLLRESKEILQRENYSYIEIKSDHELDVTDTGYRSLHNHYYHYLLPITRDADAMFGSFHKNMVQRAIMKAEREGVEIIRDNSPEGLRVFYHLNCLTHRKHGIPPPQFSFFQRMFEVFQTSNTLILLLAKINQLYIAAGIFAAHQDTIYYMYGASDQRHLKLRANQLLLWNIIKWGIDNKYSMVELGRASSENIGLRDYKKRWNSSELPLYYYYSPEIKGVGSIDRKGMNIRLLRSLWKHAPVCFVRNSGIFYKHLA